MPLDQSPNNAVSLDAVNISAVGAAVISGGRPLLSWAYTTGNDNPTAGVSVTLELQIIPDGPFIQFGSAQTALDAANIIGTTPMPVHQARLRQTGTLTGGVSPRLTGRILFM